MLSGIALLAISGYQRHISPRKGFACAYRVAHGRPSCFRLARRVIERRGLLAGLALLRLRLHACTTAAATLAFQVPNHPVVNEGCPLWSQRAWTRQWLPAHCARTCLPT